MTRTAVLLVSALTCSLSSGAVLAQPQPSEPTLTVTTFWVTTTTMAPKDRKIYARYSADRDPTKFLHQMSFVCPKERGRFAYLNIFLRDMIALGAVYKPVEGEVGIDGRFTINAQTSFTLPGHTAGTQLFFDRTPGSWDQLDQVLKATTIQLTIGKPATTVTYRTNPEFDALMHEMASQNPNMTGAFTTDAVLADCRKYRGDGTR